MWGNWVLFFYLATVGYTDGFPPCCLRTDVNGDVYVNCQNCQLSTVPNGIPVNTTFLDLSFNNITTIHNNAFKHLKNLKTLHLKGNNLKRIYTNAFKGLSQLETLNLSDNSLRSSIDSDVFCSLSKLTELDLKRNLFHLDKAYPEDALICLRTIRFLHIDVFDGFKFGDGFKQLTYLHDIDLLGIGKVSITNSSFLGLEHSSIINLKLSFQISELQINALSPFQKLQYLTIRSSNSLEVKAVLAGMHGLQNRTMELVDIGENIAPYSPDVILHQSDFTYLKTMCVRKLCLDKNNIAGVPMDAILFWTSRTCLRVIDVSNNKFITGQLYTLLTLFPALEYLYASNAVIKNQRLARYIHNKKTVFVPSSLIYINASYSFLNGDMPHLTIAAGNSIRVVDVSYPRKFSCSRGLLMGLVHLTELYMSGVNCSNPNRLMFSSMKKLSKLEAINCNFGNSLVSDSISLFEGLSNLSLIDLTANRMRNINPLTFTHQTDSLKILILAKNYIERVPSKILETMLVLETLDLTHNVISTLTESDINLLEEMKKRSKVFNIKLSDNPLLCTCEHVEFLLWLATTKTVSDKRSLTCLTTDGQHIEVHRFIETITDFQQECESNYWIIVALISFSFFLTVGVVVYFIHQKKICDRMPWEKKKSQMTDFQYDAFVAYSHHDTAWFKQYLVPMLERKGITFCCYDLNFEAGKSIVDNIIDHMHSSRKILFLVSYNFIHSEWGTYEIGIASKFAFRDGREHMNIIIFLDDIKRSEMPRVLRMIWDRIVCLKWPRDREVTDIMLQAERKRFYRMLFESIQRGNKRGSLKYHDTAL